MSCELTLVSQKNSLLLIVGLIALFILTTFLGSSFWVRDHSVLYIFAIFTFILGYFLWAKFVTAITNWKINDNCLEIIWIKDFAFAKNENINLKLNEIESINELYERYYYHLIIKPLKGEELNFYISRSVSRADFEGLIKALDLGLVK